MTASWLLMSALLAAPPTLADSEPRVVIAADLHQMLGDAKAESALLAHLDATAKASGHRLAKLTGARSADIADELWLQVAKNLEAKRALPPVEGHAFTLSADALRQTVIDYEAFKLESYVSSGVFPKRYFGYFDLRWDTAAPERRLREVVHGAVESANAFLAARHSPIRITDEEIAVTWLAEGGAVLLRENQAKLNDIHPVYDIGLDDIAIGFKAYAPLVDALDAKFGTSLKTVVEWRAGDPYLARNFKYEESILGTVVMWVYEKERAQGKLLAANRAGLETRDAIDQFILSSLVYNSGQLFDDARIAELRGFATGAYICALSTKMKSKRPELPVRPPKEALTRLMESGEYPEQPTSWSTVYHVLQRWGAYEGLRRFTTTFDEQGRFRAQ